MASTRGTVGEQATLERLIGRAELDTFEEDSAVTITSHAFNRGGARHVILPNVTQVQYYGFERSGVRTVDFGSDVALPDCFAEFTLLDAVIFRHPRAIDAVCHGASTSQWIFRGTPIELCEGSIYVPDHLVETYMNYVNWTISDNADRAYRMLCRDYIHVNPISAYPITDHSTIKGSWADVIADINAGTYRSKYFPGDTKLLELNDGTTLYMQLAAVDADTLSSGTSEKAATTWLVNGICPYKGTVDSVKAHAWPECELRAWLRDELFPLLPAVIRRNVKEVRKHYMTDYTNVYSSSDDHEQVYGQCNDTIWIPSTREVHDTHTYTTESPDANYYDRSYSLRKRFDTDMTVGPFWTRDSRSNGASYIADGCFLSSGSVMSGFVSADQIYNIVFGFCL